MRVEQVTDPVAYHGEGPAWSPRWGGLRWVDMLAGDLLFLDADGRVGRRHVGSVAAVVRPRRGGGAVLGVERGFALEEPDGSIRYLPALWSSTAVRMNEGGCDPDGRFYCGSMGYDQRPGAGSLYRLDPDLSVHTVLDEVTISNGLEWSPDGSRAFYNDPPTHRISIFDYDSDAGLTNRRTFAELPDGGSPDGLTSTRKGGAGTPSTTVDACTGTDLMAFSTRSSRSRHGRSPRAPSEVSDSTSCSSPPHARGCRTARTPWPVRCSGPALRSPACRCTSSPGDPGPDLLHATPTLATA